MSQEKLENVLLLNKYLAQIIVPGESIENLAVDIVIPNKYVRLIFRLKMLLNITMIKT